MFFLSSSWLSSLARKLSSSRVANRQRRASRRMTRTQAIELLEPRIVLSAPDQWLQRGLSGGGVLLEPALSPHNPNEFYVGTDMSQVFHTKDGGQAWDLYNFNEFVMSNKVTGVQFTSDPQVLFAIDTDTLAFPKPIRSTDSGATWDRVGSAGFASNWKSTEQAWRMFADPNSAGRLVVATQDELYLSTDAGTTFTSVYAYMGTISASQKLGLHLAGVFFDGPNIYAATNAGLLLSTNGGGFQTATVGGNAIGGIGANEVFFAFAGATNGTTTRFWAVTHDPATVHTPLDHGGANPAAANTYAGFKNLYTLDLGQVNWSVQTTGLPVTADLSYVAMAVNDIDTVYVGGQNTANNFVSVYIGKFTTANPTWTSLYQTQGAGANIVAGFVGPGGHIGFSPGIEGLAVDPQDSTRLMMTDGWVAHTSTNGGGLWQQINVPLSQDHAPGATISDTEAYNNTGINNTTVWWIHFSSATNIFAAYDDVKWQRTTDSGATWSFDVNGLDQKRENFSIEVDATTGRMYVSQGRSWGPHDILGLTDTAINQGGGDIAYSDDGGANWTVLYDFGNPVSWTALDPNDPQTMYASVIDPDPSIGGVYVSHNIGAGAAVTFTRLAAQPSSLNVGKPHTIEVLDDGTLVLVLTARKHDHDGNSATADQQSAGSGVFRLDPGASQWTDVTGANMHYWCKDLTIDPHDPTQSTWYVAVATAIAPFQVVAGQPSNQSGLYMTTNRGASWTRVFTQDTDSFAVDPNNPSDAYLAANSDGLWYSSNLRLADGVTINPNPTFTKVTSFPHQRPNRVFFNPYVSGEVWIASNGAGMLVGNASSPDRTFEFSTANFSVNENAGSATLTVQRTGDTANVMSVDYRISDGTATNGSDYTSTNLATGITGTLTFLPGQSSVMVSLPIINDSAIEGNQTVLLSLSGPIGGNFLGPNANATLTIVDDDTVPTLSINDVSLTEANTTATFTVTLSAASGQTVTVNFATANGSAVANADYTTQSGSLTFAPGETTKTITVPVLGDTLDEPDETFVVNLSGATNASIADAQGLGTILDNDAVPSLSSSDVLLTEGNTTATFTVTLSTVSGQTVTVDFATANGSAVTGADYTSQSGSLTFAPGETTKTISIPVLGDSLDEPDETFVVNLSDATNASIADAQGLGTITDDDATPSLSIGDVSLTEGNTTATFTVTLSAASGQTVTVDFATANSSAVAGADYTSQTGSVTFAPGETTKTISVPVLGDLLDEPDETFVVNLSNATIADAQGLGTILDDDATPSLSIDDVSITEANTTATFTVTLSAASGRTVTVDYGTTDDSAAAGGDYTAAVGSLTFAPGETTKSIAVPISGDTTDEDDERFTVDLSNAINAVMSDSKGLGTILDDDAAPSLTIGDVTVTEGNSGQTPATFTISLSAVSSKTVTLDFATANSSAHAPGDYSGTSGSLTFAPGETTKTLSVLVEGDLTDEADEQFLVNLSNAVNATMADSQAKGTITDDDFTPKLSISNVTVTEGDSGTTDAIFTLTLSAPGHQAATVSYATTSSSAVAGTDFNTTTGSVTFDVGETTKTVTVPVLGDATDEPDEIFHLNLTSITGAVMTNNFGVGTITDDDAPPTLSINDVTVTEGQPTATFTVTLSAASSQTVTVGYMTVSGSAFPDFTATSGTLTFAAGETSKTLNVALNEDVLDEADENFSVILSTTTNANVGDGTGMATILDNDAAPSLSIKDVTLTEGNSGTTTATFTVTLSTASGQTVLLDYATADGTALAASDYTASSGTLSLVAGLMSKTFTVPIIGDVLDEPSETFVVNLSNAINASFSDNQAVGTITDNDAAPSLTINDVIVTEGESALFTVTLSAVSGQSVTVNYATSNSTALAGSDYETQSGTLTFAPGEKTKTVAISTTGDTLDEASEKYFVNLSSAINATISDSQGLGTITDDDAAPSLSISDVTVTEGKTATFTVNLSAPSGQTVTVKYATAASTVTASTDYTTTSGTLTFAAGATSQTLSVVIKADTLDELDETFFVNLSSPTNATITDSQAIGTIIDDDAAPALSIKDVTVTEGNSGTKTATFTASLSTASGKAVTVDYATADNTALAGTDYITTSGTLTIAAGTTSKTFTVSIKGDTLDEASETFFVNLSNAINATISDSQALGTIKDNDAAPTLKINNVTVTEGDAGSSTATFTVTLSEASGQPVTVNYATANSTAVSGNDYTAQSGTLTFAPGEKTKSINIAVTGDTLDEVNESYNVNLSSATNATISDSKGIGTITDNDAAPTLSINDVSIVEGDSGTSTATFTVTLSAASGQTVTVKYATANNSAIAPGDYTTTSGTLTFAAGVTSKTLTVSIKGDVLSELDEQFFVNLSSPTNASLTDSQAIALVLDDDA